MDGNGYRAVAYFVNCMFHHIIQGPKDVLIVK
jgi:hypothetical protein